MEKPIVLLVDDEVDTLKTIKISLEVRGYSVVTAENGEKALEILQTVIPGIIIADIRMQPINGFELYQQVKKTVRLSKIPFFFLTAVDDSLAKKYGQKLGVDAYITKPVDLDRLDERIMDKLKEQ